MRRKGYRLTVWNAYGRRMSERVTGRLPDVLALAARLMASGYVGYRVRRA